MVTITAKLENMDAVQRALQAYGKAAEAEIGKAIQATALGVRGGIQTRIQRGPKTGVVYTRRNTLHRASAPGEAPATDTGTLVSSITFRMAEPLTAEIESRLDYATYLEFGTANMAPRPAWVPEVEARTPELRRRVEDAIRKVTP
jgi:hypothetical protein